MHLRGAVRAAVRSVAAGGFADGRDLSGVRAPDERVCPHPVSPVSGGTSAGLLPDLFAAALIDVGDCDMLRIETTTNGVPNIPEFGTVTEKSGFKGLYEMSALHHVEDGSATRPSC